MTAPGALPEDSREVEIRLPAEGAYAAVLRTTTAALAARLDFTIDDIEDLRMAVAEANAMVLEQADPGSDLVCTCRLAPGRMVLSVSVASAGAVPDLQSFAWQVLTTLAADADIDTSGGRYTVTMTMTSSLSPAHDPAHDPATGAGA